MERRSFDRVVSAQAFYTPPNGQQNHYFVASEAVQRGTPLDF